MPNHISEINRFKQLYRQSQDKLRKIENENIVEYVENEMKKHDNHMNKQWYRLGFMAGVKHIKTLIKKS